MSAGETTSMGRLGIYPAGLVIFDCDGVLVDSEGLIMQTLQRILANYDLWLTLKQLQTHFAGLSIADVKFLVG